MQQILTWPSQRKLFAQLHITQGHLLKTMLDSLAVKQGRVLEHHAEMLCQETVARDSRMV